MIAWFSVKLCLGSHFCSDSGFIPGFSLVFMSPQHALNIRRVERSHQTWERPPEATLTQWEQCHYPISLNQSLKKETKGRYPGHPYISTTSGSNIWDEGHFITSLAQDPGQLNLCIYFVMLVYVTNSFVKSLIWKDKDCHYDKQYCILQSDSHVEHVKHETKGSGVLLAYRILRWMKCSQQQSIRTSKLDKLEQAMQWHNISSGIKGKVHPKIKMMALLMITSNIGCHVIFFHERRKD